MEQDFDKDFAKTVEDGVLGVLNNLTPEEQAAWDARSNDRLTAAIQVAIRESGIDLAETLKRRAAPMLAERRQTQAEMEERVSAHWGAAFDLTEMVMQSAMEMAEFFYKKHVPPDGVHDWTFEALARLQARACRIAEEVLVLLKAGYGQAAMARWRALDEVAVVADFIAANGDECAERYFAHEGIETWRAMEEFQQHAEELGETPYSASDVQAVQRQRDMLIGKYGPPFAGHYGWAHAALAAAAPDGKVKTNLQTIEESVGTTYIRPYLRMASHGIHANPKGVMWTPDLMPAEQGLVLLTGPSLAGLADPGYRTVFSLVRITATTLASKRGEATGYIVGALLRLRDDAGDAYLATHRKLEDGSLGRWEIPGATTQSSRPARRTTFSIWPLTRTSRGP